MSLDDFDFEAAIEAELARTRLENSDLNQEGKGEAGVFWRETGLLVGKAASHQDILGRYLAVDDTDDEDEDEDEPPSLQLLRTAFERRERAAEAFGREWQRFCNHSASDEHSWPVLGPGAVSDTSSSGPPLKEPSPSCAASERRGESERMHECQAVRGEKSTHCVEAATRSIKTDLTNHQLYRRAGDESAGAKAGTAEGLPERTQDMHEQQCWALAKLNENLAKAASDLHTEAALATMEQSRLAAEVEATLHKLDMAAKQAALREGLQGATLAALREEALDVARQHLAAWRIGRAWRKYRQGSTRAARLAAVLRIQAAWRGHVGRRRASQLRVQRVVLQAVEEACQYGRAEELHLAIQQAQETGLIGAVRVRLAVVEAAAADAAAKLRASASNGSHLEYRAALVTAKAFPKLLQLVAESTTLFEGRRADAEAALWAAVADKPMRSFFQVLDSIAHMGIEPDRLRSALDAIRQRDEQLLAKLAAASKACSASFRLADFEALMERALCLGLKGEAAAARLVVERRRRSIAVALRARISGPFLNAAEHKGVLEEARRMGLAAEAEELERELHGRQCYLQAAIRRVVLEESAARNVIIFRHAIDLHVQAAHLQDSQLSFSNRRAACGEILTDAASSGSLHAFLAARGAGAYSGVEMEAILAADRTLESRQHASLCCLVRATKDICVGACPPLKFDASTAMAAEFSDARVLLKRACDLAASASCSKAMGSEGGGASQGSDLQLQIFACGSVRDPAHLNFPFALPSLEVKRSPFDLPCSPWGKTSKGFLHCGRQLVLLDIRSAYRSTYSAAALDWALLTAMVRLGLPDMVCLALCILELHHSVLLAEGSRGLATLVMNDYWGVALPSAANIQEFQGTTAALGSGSSSMALSLIDGRDDEIDEISNQAVLLLRRRKGVICIRGWVAPAGSLVWLVRPFDAPSDKSLDQVSLTLAPEHDSKDTALLEYLLMPSFGCCKSLAEVISLKSETGATSECPASAAARLPHLLRLDLCLERLTSLQGLDLVCPMLRSLSADANQMSSLEGLQGLSCLQELSLKQNHLTSLLQLSHAGQAVGALPSGSCLKRVMLDSNKLSGELRGLKGCSGLRSLSLASNFLTDVGTELEPCKAVLTSLSLRNNRLTTAKGQLVCLTNLRELDVSGNRLTSLEGLQGLLLLQSLCASGNAVAAMPKPFWLPHLTTLDLGQNALTSFGNCGDAPAGYCLTLPSLKRLLLRENSISLLGALGPMLHLTWLDLSFNNFASVEAFRALVHLSGLRKLNIANNPVTDAGSIDAERPSQRRQTGAALINSPLRQLLPPMTADSTGTMAWSLPSLQELDYGCVAAHHRLDSVVRATAVSPICAMAGVRQLRTMGYKYLVLRRSMSMQSTAATGCQLYAASSQCRVPAVDRFPGRPGLLFTGASGTPIDSAALKKVLIATVNASLDGLALCGLHAEEISYNRTSFGQSPLHKFTAQREPDAQDSVITHSGARCIKLKCDRMAWLIHLGRRWQASLPWEILYLHWRQLSGMPCLGPRNCTASGLEASSTSVVAMHPGADILDTPAARWWRPTFRLFQYLTVADLWCKARKHTKSTATADIRSGEVASEASVLAICAEAYWRSDASSSQTGRQLMEELLRFLQHHYNGSIGRSSPALRSDQLTARPSFFMYRMQQHAKAAATVVQASLRGLRARKSIPLLYLETQNSKAARMAAATVVQAWWRGHHVRRLLYTLRKDGKMWRQDLHRREAATIVIQAYFRGYLVRKRLSTALAAVKLSRGLSKDYDELSDRSELEEILQGFLSPLEDLFVDGGIGCNWMSTSPSVASTAPWAPPGKARESHVRQPRDRHDSSCVAGDCSTAACAELQTPTRMAVSDSCCEAPHGPLSGVRGAYSRMPPSIAVLPNSHVIQVYPAAAAVQCSDLGQMRESTHMQRGCLDLLPAHSVSSAGFFPFRLLSPFPSQSSAPQRDNGPVPLEMPYCESSMAKFRCSQHEDLPPLGCSGKKGDLASEFMCTEHEPFFSDVITANNREERQHRHLERLRKLMAEWGFKDLCTAETYYRRVLRQKQGNARRQFQERLQVPSQRPLVMPRPEARNVERSIMPSSMLQLTTSSATNGGEELPGLPSSPRLSVNSADNVLLYNNGYTRDVLSHNNRGSNSADIISPVSGNRHVLAPLGAASACKLPYKLGTAQRPHHLPTMTSNNWVGLPSSQSLTQSVSVGRNTLYIGRQAMAKANPHSVSGKAIRDRPGVGRPETVQSVD